MNTYPISKENQNHELQNIKTILQNNNYPPHTYINTKTRMNINTTPSTTLKQKWSAFTYTSRETKTITRLFKNNNLRIAYKTKNTLQNT
jgi:hypothetical protein